MELRNDNQVNKFLLDIIAKEVVEEVTEKMLLRLKENIMKYVYLAQNNNIYAYGGRRPTYQFYRAWDFTPMKNYGKKIVTQLYYNPQDMDYDPDNFIHGNERYGDARKTLMDILNVKGNTNKGAGHPFLYKYTSAPYWDNTIKEFFDRRRIEIDIGHSTRRISRSLGVKIKKVI